MNTVLSSAQLASFFMFILFFGRSNGGVCRNFVQGPDPMQVIFTGSMTSVLQLVNGIPNVNLMFGADGSTLLHWAAYSGRYEIVDFLVGRGASVHVRNFRGQTPLHCAASWGRIRIATLLVVHGARINAEDNDGLAPLHCAITRRQSQIIMPLFRLGANVNLADNAGRRPVEMVNAADCKTYRELLMCRPALTLQDCALLMWKDIHHAVYHGDVERVKSLVSIPWDAATDVDRVGSSPLHYAVIVNNAEITRLLAGWQPVNFRDIKRQTPFHIAVQLEHMELIPILLTHDANIRVFDKDSESPLGVARKRGNNEMENLLLAKRIKCQESCVVC